MQSQRDALDLKLTADEAALLRRILEQHLGELRVVVSNTENYEWRQSMKRDEESIKSMLQRLGQGA